MRFSPFEPCEVTYETEFGTLARGYVAEHAISPLTGKCQLRVVDFVSEASDPDAGKWLYSHECEEVGQ